LTIDNKQILKARKI